MKSGTLLIIGCGKYNNSPDLLFAENDAKVVHDELKTSTALYSNDRSLLALSPTSSEFRQLVIDHAENIRGSNLATIYFSGHGDTVNGSFYLCFKDYSPSVPSATGVTISELLRLVSDLGIPSVNIIIDACYSGQAQRDLREVSENPSYDGKMCLSVNLIAASLPFQPAFGGMPLSDFTSVLVQFIRGERDSNLPKHLLSITDLGAQLAEGQVTLGHQQNLVFSAINLLGEIPLFENPLFTGERSQPHTKLLSPSSNLGSAVFTTKEFLARSYKDLPTEFDDVRLLRAFRSICDSAEGDGEELLKLLFHYSNWFSSRLDSSTDWSLRFRLSAVLVAASLPISATNKDFRDGMISLVRSSLEYDAKVLNDFSRNRDLEQIGLHGYSSIDDLYYLPIRLSAIYGRIALISELERYTGVSYFDDLSIVLECMFEERLNSHVIFSERQAFQLHLFFQALAGRKTCDITNQVFGAYVNDHVSVQGCSLRDNAESSQILEYLRCRHDSANLKNVSGIARPNSVLPVLMLSAGTLELDDVLDPWLFHFNRTHTNIFLSSSYGQFGNVVLEDGVNLHLEVGKDFYSCSGFSSRVRDSSRLAYVSNSLDSDLRLLLLTCCHLMPDRLVLELKS